MDFTFDDLCRHLKAGENLTFSRWGDGEWSAVLGYEGSNCDGHAYFADMSLALATVLLQKQRYYMGMQPKAIRDMPEAITTWLKAKNCDVDWCDADILHDASIAGRMSELHVALRGRKVVLVGPKHLKEFAEKNRWAYVFVPDRNCWKWFTTIYSDILDEIDKDVVVLYCCSMTTEVLMDKAHREYGSTITQIDCGSVFDPYCGRATRRYHKEIIERADDV